MARVRIPGGFLDAEQLRQIASITEDLTSGYIQITTRANLQIRVIQPENTDRVLKRLRKAGFHPAGAGADNPRNVTTNPTTGFDPFELIDTSPYVRQISKRVTSDPSLSNIPGKYNIALDNGGQATVMEDSNDLSAHAVSFGGDDVKFRISLGGVGEKKDLGILVESRHLTETMVSIMKMHNLFRDQKQRLRFRAKYLWEKYTKKELLEELMEEVPEGVPIQRTTIPRPNPLPTQ